MLLFLNNDTEVLEEEWLDRMLQWFERPGVGVVGAKLLYPNGRVQHAGVILGIGGLAGHIFTEERENTFGFFGTDGWYRNLSAVTGACLMIPRDLYERIGGFDETFQLIYSDVQLCLRATDLGYRVVYTPEARLLHHESATHHRRIPRVDFENATRKWKLRLEKGDPFFNPNLTCGSSRPVLRMGKETPVALNELLMQKLPQKEIILLPGDLS
jgi:GT2 family glycosyltransferase